MCEIGALSINRKKMKKKRGKKMRVCPGWWRGRGPDLWVEVGGCSIGIFQPGGDKKVKKKMIIINK